MSRSLSRCCVCRSGVSLGSEPLNLRGWKQICCLLFLEPKSPDSTASPREPRPKKKDGNLRSKDPDRAKEARLVLLIKGALAFRCRAGGHGPLWLHSLISRNLPMRPSDQARRSNPPAT